MQRYEDEIVVLYSCLKISPIEFKDQIYNNLAFSYCSLGLTEKARITFQGGIKHFPGSARLHFNYGNLLF